MKSRRCYQATVLLSYLGVFSFTTANPLPENSYGSELGSINMFNDDDPSSSDISWDDTSAVGSGQGNPMLSLGSASTTDLSSSGSIDGSLIAYGDKLKAPYCGTTEQPVCCSQISEAGYTGCRYCKASHPIRPLLSQVFPEIKPQFHFIHEYIYRINFIHTVDPSDFVNCQGPNQACCNRIVSVSQPRFFFQSFLSC